jgi:signal transduction histidine kinase
MSTDSGVPIHLDDVDTRPTVRSGQILVVDDVPANLVAAEAALAPLNRRLVMASSGNDALARLLDDEFSLVLLDVQMPGMDGYETARWIRSRERTQHLPIIFTTAHDHDQAAVLRAYALGAVDFLAKPIVPEILRAKASVFVNLHERTEQLATERMERQFDNRRRDYEATALRRERDRELVANRALARLHDALAESDRRKDSFLAILAHELRNPMAPLRTCIDLVRRDPEHKLTDRMLEILDRQTGLLSRLVDDLLDVSRIKAGKIELRPEPVNLVDVIESALATSRPLIDERKHSFHLEAPSEHITVIVDTVRMGQVLSNLLNNAARYTPRGGRITVSCGTADEYAVVRVVDSGAGIPPELQDSIFKMFVQERVASDGSGGLGLGLALSRRLVELHRGTISVHSAGRGRGSTFEIRLPLPGGELSLQPRKRTGDMPPLTKDGPMPGTICAVVVDDNEDACELLADLLRAHGYCVLTAHDGPSGVDLIRAQRPQIALVDLGLPGMDGIAVVEALRGVVPDLRTRLVAVTGFGAAADRERTRRAGFHAHLVKPAPMPMILECLAKQLEQHDAT